MICPCQSAQPYTMCCQIYHLGAAAPTPEALMRSRYCAYALGLVSYIQQTWYSATLPTNLSCDNNIKWLGLSIRKHYLPNAQPGNTQTPHQAQVEFIARYKVGGQRAERLHELSRFIYEPDAHGNWRWYYVDGVFNPVDA